MAERPTKFVAVKLDRGNYTDRFGLIGYPKLDELTRQTQTSLGWPKPNEAWEVKRMLTYAAEHMPRDYRLDAVKPVSKVPEAALLDAVDQGLTEAELAERFGVTVVTVGRRWRVLCRKAGIRGRYGRETAERIRLALAIGYSYSAKFAAEAGE